jgi:hypothetical protein
MILPWLSSSLIIRSSLPVSLFLLSLFLLSALVGVTVCILVLLYGYKAEVAAWSLVNLMSGQEDRSDPNSFNPTLQREKSIKERAVGAEVKGYTMDFRGPLGTVSRREELVIAAAVFYINGHPWEEARQLAQKAYEDADGLMKPPYGSVLLEGVERRMVSPPLLSLPA